LFARPVRRSPSSSPVPASSSIFRWSDGNGERLRVIFLSRVLLTAYLSAE
jgi:hypothetical protein